MNFADSNVAELVGWSLLHFLWQGALIALVVWGALALVTSKKPNIRYAISCCGLLAMAISPIVTMYVISGYQAVNTRVAVNTSLVSDQPTLENINSKAPPLSQNLPSDNANAFKNANPIEAVTDRLDEDSAATNETQTTVGTIPETLIRLVSPMIPHLALIWTACVSMLSLKLIVCWFRVRKIQTSGTLIDDPKLTALLERLKTQLKMNFAVPLRESIEVNSPMVIGWLKPVILFPASAISGLNEQQLSAILIHELAHIRRADYLVNVCQSIIETLLFYHPAVWWLSNRIRLEREHCCDDLAVQISGDKRNYVTALLQLEQSCATDGTFALSSNGGDLVQRVARMLDRDRNSTGRSSWIAAFTAVAIVGAIFAGLWLDTSSAQANSIQEKDETTETVEPTEDESEVRKIKVLVKTPDGKPLFNASITLGVWYKETAETLNFTTDKDGAAELPVPDDLKIYRLWASAVGYTPLFANWEEDEIKKGTLPPDEFTFKMIAAVEIGGIVVDKDGQPIENVAVQVRGNGAGANLEGRVRLSTHYALNDNVKTDADGRWSVANIPPGDDVVISLKLNHSDFKSDENWGDLQAVNKIGLKELRDKSAKLVMAKGIQVRGRVIDEAGKPIENALVVWGDSPYWQEGSQEIFTDADGRYETPTQKDGDLRITIMAPGFSPETTKVKVGPRLKETDFVMSSGNRLELRFVDEAGEAVSGAYAQIDGWRSAKSIYNYRHPNVKNSRIPIGSDENGVYVWDWAPDDPVTFVFSARGYIAQRGIEITASEEPTTIVMRKPKSVSGKVTDANGVPVPNFSIIPRLHLNDRITHEHRRDIVKGKDGKFSLKIDRQLGDYSLLIEAKGYESAFTEKFPRDNPPEFDIQLTRAVERKYRVVNENGEPVVDATIIAAPIDQTFSTQSYFDTFAKNRVLNATSDSKGAFTIPNSKTPRTLLAVTRDRFGEVSDSPDNPESEIAMKEWASLKYFVTKNGVPWLTGHFLRENRYNNGRFFHIQHYRMTGASDGNGIFKQKYVAAMPQAIDIFAKGDPGRMRYQIAFEPKPGEEFEIDFTDCPSLKANVSFSGNNSSKVDSAKSRFMLTRLEPSVNIPAELAREIKVNDLDPSDVASVLQWFRDRENFDASTCFSNCFDSYSGTLTDDGKLAIDVLKPGKYSLSISANVQSNWDRSSEPLSNFSKVIEIGNGVNDLGSMTVPVFEDPEPNSIVENFDFTVRTDKTKSSLEKFKGNYLLLDFWTPWSDKCGEYTPKIQSLAKRLAAKGKTNMVSLMANGSGPVVRVPTRIPDGMKWIDGRVSQADERHIRRRLGAWTAQHFVLIDPEGKYVVGGSLATVVKKMQTLGLR